MNTVPNWLSFLSAFPIGDGVPPWEQHWNELDGSVLFMDEREAMKECGSAPIPFTVLPIGIRNNHVIGLDASVSAIEAGRLGLVESTKTGFWTPLVNTKQGQVFRDKVGFSSLVERVRESQRNGDEDMEVSLLSALFRRPIYTAEQPGEVEEMMERVLTLHASRGAETLSQRLSAAGRDGEKWRIIGAERAIAGRTRDAIVALSGAHFWGAELHMIALPASQTLGNAGWKWNSRMLKFHKKRLRESA